MATAWLFLLARYPIRDLEALIQEWALRLGWDRLSGTHYSADQVRQWFSYGAVDLGLMTDWQRSFAKDGISLDQWLAETGLRRFEDLRVHVIAQLLLRASPETLVRLGGKALAALADGQRRDVQSGFGQRYLCDIEPSDRWDDHAIEWILRTWGKPTLAELQTPFWRKIPPEVRDEVRSWQALRELQKLLERFDDPHGRFTFWKQFKRHVRDYRVACPDGSTGQCLAICMEFDGWGAIEFGPVGNATYVYPLAAYRRMSAQTSRDPSAYKDLQKTIRGGPEGDGRIIHRAGWQTLNRAWIQGLIAGRGR